MHVPVLQDTRFERDVAEQPEGIIIIIIIIIIDNICIALFSGVHKLIALYNILRHLLR